MSALEGMNAVGHKKMADIESRGKRQELEVAGVVESCWWSELGLPQSHFSICDTPVFLVDFGVN